MRDSNSTFNTWYEGESIAPALVVSIERVDGVVLGFTSWDVPIVYDGIEYEPTASLESAALKQTSDLRTDNMDVLGVLDSDRITTQDLKAGKYDGAEVIVRIVNPADLSMLHRTMFRGEIGELTILDNSYVGEVRSKVQRASQQFGELVSQTCRACKLGEPPCAPGGLFDNGDTIADYQETGRVVTEVVDAVTIKVDSSMATLWYSDGLVIFNNDVSGGLNQSLSREIKTATLVSGVNVIVLQEPFPYAIQVGDEMTLEAGCDRLENTCQAKFDNRRNFQGESNLPGNDRLTAIGRPPA